jgi:hypothetical protein
MPFVDIVAKFSSDASIAAILSMPISVREENA